MTKKVFLDIETLPPCEQMRDKIALDIQQELLNQEIPFDGPMVAKLVDERFRNLALKPEFGRILTIGLIIEQDNHLIQHGLLGRTKTTKQFHLDERQTLQSFWNLLKDFDSYTDLFIGHNVLDFDLQFIRKRSIINGVKPTLKLNFTRFHSQPIFDTMWEWASWQTNQKVKLSILAEALGLPSSKSASIDGSKVYDLFLNGQHDEIAYYCMRDVESVREIFYHMNFLDAPFLQSYAAKHSPLLSLMKASR